MFWTLVDTDAHCWKERILARDKDRFQLEVALK
jgi:hypothetical protein